MGAFDPAANAASATGFLLLTVNGCRLISSVGDPPDKYGTLEVICVTLHEGDQSFSPQSSSSSPTRTQLQSSLEDLSKASSTSSLPKTGASTSRTNPEVTVNLDEPDVWLVLRIDGFETPVSPLQTIMQSRSKGTFTFLERPGEKPRSLTLVLPTASIVDQPHLVEDLETLEVLFSQYGVLQQIDRDELGSDGDLKGRLVLVDQNDGEYVGWLGNDISVTEDPWVERSGRDPVVVEISEDGQHLNVHPVRPEDEDMMLRGAGMISRGIVFFGEAVSSGLNKASKLYIQHATPSPEPVVLSDTTRNNVQRVHTISGHAVTITQKTTGVIHGLIDKMATKIGNTASGSSTPNRANNASPALGGQRSTPDGSTTIEQPEKPKFLSRLLLSTNMVVSAVEQSATTMIQSGGKSVAAGIHHKYGAQAGEAAESVGRTVHNVSAIYIDAQGIGRNALLKRMGKGVVKAKIGKKDVVVGNQVPPGTAVPAGLSGSAGTAQNASSTSLAGGSAGVTSAYTSARASPAPIPVPYQPRQRSNNPRSASPSPSRTFANPSGAGFVPPPTYDQTLNAGARPAPPPLPPR